MASGSLKNELAEKLRFEDPEQFNTLVRMHLSFVLDLNTDDYEGSEKNKFRPSKWVFGKKAKCLAKGVMEGAPLTQEGICQAYQLIEYLSKESSIRQEGLFRRTGKLTRQQELKALLNKGVSLDLDDGNFSVHDCASVLKSFLAELPEPLLTDAHYPIYCQIAEFCGPAGSSGQNNNNNDLRLLHSLQLLLLLLPAENRILLQDVLRLLSLTASYECYNKMSAESLSTLFTPHLLCPRKLTPEAFHANSQAMSGIVAFMIHKGGLLFEIPPKLATDIQVYWAERERRNILGRRKIGESLQDGPTANTVFTFVDRERSAQENLSNPTEIALAQLYAHIQSLPESSKKRKLIKQFNKENGQGTPRQESYRHKHHHRSKSLGDSIKKHIFNKGTKCHKSSNRSNGFGALRSVSQEVLNSPLTPASKTKLFHSSMEAESSTSMAMDPIANLPDLQQSLCDSNSSVLRLRHSTRTLGPSFANRLIFSESSGRANDELDTSVRDAILYNLAHQVSQHHSPDPEKSISRKARVLSFEGMESPLLSSNSFNKESPTCVTKLDGRDASKSRLGGSSDSSETMMTPRSRKPVVVLSGSNICHLSNVTSWQQHTAILQENYKEIEMINNENKDILIDNSVHSNKELTVKNVSSCESIDGQSGIDNEDNCEETSHTNCCGSGDSLTSTFKSYLMSRSVLTASPVDLSFSSRTEDFDTSLSNERCLSTDALSDSLLYCLDGNDPKYSDKSCCSQKNYEIEHKHLEHSNKHENNTCSVTSSNSEAPPSEIIIESHLRTPVHETSL